MFGMFAAPTEPGMQLEPGADNLFCGVYREMNGTSELEAGLVEWSEHLPDEVRYWSKWAETEGDRWHEDFVARLDPNTPISSYILPYIKNVEAEPARILDVGSGPCTGLGYKSAKPVEITAVDPLAGVYKTIFAKHNLRPPVQTRFATAEDLSLFVESDHFDLVHCRNALDHAIDPMAGIREMIRVAKGGATVLLLHYENEAVNANYHGLHQHNFAVVNGHFLIWNNRRNIDVAAELAGIADVRATVDDGSGGRRSVRAEIRRTAPLPTDYRHDDIRLASVLRAFAAASSRVEDKDANDTLKSELQKVRAVLKRQETELVSLTSDLDVTRRELERRTADLRRTEIVLAEERRSALNYRAREDKLHDLIERRRREEIQEIAREVWWERNRRGLPYKIGKAVKRLAGHK